jgi:hypothetical protein
MTITTVTSVAQATLTSPSLALKKIKRSTHQVDGEVPSKMKIFMIDYLKYKSFFIFIAVFLNIKAASR